MTRFALLSLFAVSSLVVIAQPSVNTRSSPDWILSVDYPQSTQDTVGSGGYYYLLSEWQEHVEKQEAFFRVAVKVLSPKGLSLASSVSVNFDPSYQRLYFHKLVIRRGGRELDQLNVSKFELLRREENMDRQIYDKSLDAMMPLSDVQVGDIVEYSYSVVGFNPVFGGKAIKNIRLNFGVPIAKSVDRLVCSSSRKISIKTFNKGKAPVHEVDGLLQSYLWVSENLPAQLVEDNVPSWYRVYDAAEISEFASWSEVSDWALPLYAQTPADKRLIDEKVNQIKANNLLPENRVQAAIRFVQDEVRYLSFSGGIQGYKPHDPSLVLKQRFGDCKDKSLLLTTMLRSLGVSAYPALVNSTDGKTLNESLPSPYAFDHCIAQVILNDTTYWIDPTLSLERGSFKHNNAADYGFALILAPGTKDLTPIKVPQHASSMRIYETYSFDAVGEPAHLLVKTIYSGSQANSMRNYYKANDREDIKQSYTNFYANEYPEIEMIDYVSFVDNEAENIVESTENYEIKNFWTLDSLEGVYTASTYARSIANNFSEPETKVRKTPFAISHPVSVIQNITIKVPDYWPVKKASKEVSAAAFRFTSEVDYVDKKIFQRYTYESKKDHITAREAVRHVKDSDKAKSDLFFQLTYNSSQKNDVVAFNTPYLIIGLFALALYTVALVWLYRYDPRSRNYEVSYDGFGGWLVLPMIGLFLTPIFALINVSTGGFFNHIQWEILTNSSAPNYNPSLGLLVLVEYLFQLAMLAYSVFVLILMLLRRTSFPLFVVIMYAANVLFIFIDAIWLHAMDMATAFDGDDATAVIRQLVAAVIWAPYMIYSQRVKGTFTERFQKWQS